MSFKDVLQTSVLEGFSYNDFSTTKILVTLLIAYAIAMYIHLIYKFVTKKAFYYKNYGISMAIMSVVTAGIIMAMQSSLVISLGMVGALSIVRFRTAIKDPLDLLFLFWSITNGIVCGAGLYEMALLISLVTTVGIFVFQAMPNIRESHLLVINLDEKKMYAQVIDVVKKHTRWYAIKSQNTSKESMELILEVKLNKHGSNILDELFLVDGIENVNMLENSLDAKR